MKRYCGEQKADFYGTATLIASDVIYQQKNSVFIYIFALYVYQVYKETWAG